MENLQQHIENMVSAWKALKAAGVQIIEIDESEGVELNVGNRASAASLAARLGWAKPVLHKGPSFNWLRAESKVGDVVVSVESPLEDRP